jgi:hypothetical protein
MLSDWIANDRLVAAASVAAAGGAVTAGVPGMEAMGISGLAAALSLACRQGFGLARRGRDRGVLAGRWWGHGRCRRCG